jgi:hypothetical protein
MKNRLTTQKDPESLPPSKDEVSFTYGGFRGAIVGRFAVTMCSVLLLRYTGAFAGMALESYPRASARALNQGTGKDRKDCMRQFRAAWERFAGDPANLTEFLAAKRRARRTRNPP